MSINLLLTFFATYAFIVVCWVLYLAVMNLAAHRHTMGPVAKAHAYVLLGIALVFDAVLNAVVGTIIFLDWPREWTLTRRLQRYLRDPQAKLWRINRARWLCDKLLDQFAPGGKHC